MMRYVIFDLDGTLGDCNHRQHLAQSKDWDGFHAAGIGDSVIAPVADLMTVLATKARILIVTGRNHRFENITREWLKQAGIDFCVFDILMRRDDDYTRDAEMKIALLEEFFGTKDEVLKQVWFAIDDRDDVVEGLRNYGLTVMQPCVGRY